MSRPPVKRNALVPRERDSVIQRERNALLARERDSELIEPMNPAPERWFSFRYSYTEISATGGKAHVKSKRTRYEDGKLSSESFEGDVDRSVYDRMIDDAQRLFLQQTALFQQMLAEFLPAPRKRDRD